MKVEFIEARYKEKILLPEGVIRKLPKELVLFTTIQFIGSIKDIKKQLESNGIKVKLHKVKHTQYKGQLLGCSIEKFNANDFLYIGDGMFHPKALLLKNPKSKVFVFNPINKRFSIIDEKEIIQWLKRKKGALLKIMTSDNIGVLISTKPGQNKMKEALELKKKMPEKNLYFFIFDTLNFEELENFPFVECYINTACPRIAYDDSEKIRKPILNIDDVE
jgi:2-(3-amino-3-carboxypropyl)histidine synthase